MKPLLDSRSSVFEIQDNAAARSPAALNIDYLSRLVIFRDIGAEMTNAITLGFALNYTRIDQDCVVAYFPMFAHFFFPSQITLPSFVVSAMGLQHFFSESHVWPLLCSYSSSSVDGDIT